MSRGKKTRFAVIVLLAGVLLTASTGCSFIFDFTECEANADCEQFDSPDEGEFFVCSPDEKCVLEPERECRVDAHCGDGESCDEASGTCG